MTKLTRVRTVIRESANTKAVRGLMIGLAAAVVLVVSGFGTVIYIQLMGKIFPSGPLAIACYLGAAANFLLMIVLLIGKFVWFRPGWHELTSWLVTGSELLVAVFNLMLAYQLGNGAHPSGLLSVWLGLAPISPVFSMVGATLLIMTSVEMRKRHRDLELQDEKEQAERELDLAFHQAEIGVKHQYLDIITEKLTQELSAPERHQEIAAHAKVMVSQVLSEISGIQSVPVASAPALSERAVSREEHVPVISHRATAVPTPHETPVDLDTGWLEQVNERIEQERARRMAVGSVPVSVSLTRLQRIAQAAEARGYSLENLERLVGLPAGSKLATGARLVRLANAAEAAGYDLDRLERLLGVAVEDEASGKEAVGKDGSGGSVSGVAAGSEEVIRQVVGEWMGLFRGQSADGSIALRRIEDQLGLFDETAAREGVVPPLVHRLKAIASKMLSMGYDREALVRMGPELFSSAADGVDNSGPSRVELRVTRKFS